MHLVVGSCAVIAFSNSSKPPVFFSFFTKLFTAFSLHLSSPSPFFHPKSRFTIGGVNGSIDVIATLNPDSSKNSWLMWKSYNTCKSQLRFQQTVKHFAPLIYTSISTRHDMLVDSQTYQTFPLLSENIVQNTIHISNLFLRTNVFTYITTSSHTT